jgi:hypothetical protein
MAFSIQYKPLFKVNVFHQYYLNRGADEFKMMNEEKKARQLENYDFQKIINVVPTTETVGKLNGHNLVFKIGNTGFTIWGKVAGINNDEPYIALDDDLYFTFLLKINDTSFFNFTDLDMENSRKLYYFSNRKPASEPANFPLIDKAGGNHNVDDKFVLSVIGENNERKLPENQGQNNLLGIIRIFIKGDTGNLNITNAQAKISNPFKTFELNFKNRKTTWRYFFETNQQVNGNDDVKKENGSSKILITKTEKPLTNSGFIPVELGVVELPNPDAKLVKPDVLTNKYFSEIYM